MNIPLLITDDKDNTAFAIYEDGTVEFTTAKGLKKKCTTSKDMALALAGGLACLLTIQEEKNNIQQDQKDLPPNQ